MKKRNVLLFMILFTLCLSGCSKKTSENTSDSEQKIQVSVTFDALAEFTSAVGKDLVEVKTIIPNGMEPHDFEPKAADITALSNADVFVYNGLGMESWVEESLNASPNTSRIVVIASDGCDPLTNSEEESREHGTYDPHLWLSISGAKIQVQNIADGLSKADPANESFYQENAATYIAELDSLFTEYKSKFDRLPNKSFVTGHAAFHYFCRDFGLAQNSVEDVFAEGEPSTRQLAELVEYCKEHNVTTIFAEDMASPEISQTLATEVNAKVETIHTMESSEDGITYLERMEDNCKKVFESLSE